MGLHNNRKWLLMVHAEEVVVVCGDYENDGMNGKRKQSGTFKPFIFLPCCYNSLRTYAHKIFYLVVHILYSACLWCSLSERSKKFPTFHPALALCSNLFFPTKDNVTRVNVIMGAEGFTALKRDIICCTVSRERHWSYDVMARGESPEKCV